MTTMVYVTEKTTLASHYYQYYYIRGLKQPSVSRCEDFAENRNTRGHLAWAIGTGIPCMRCVAYTGYFAHGNSKGKARNKEEE